MIQRVRRVIQLDKLQKNLQDEVDKQTRKAEEKKKQFDSMLELKTEQKTEELEANMEHEKAAALEKLREETKKQLAGMQHKYDTEHDRISDEILQSMIKDVSR